MMASTLVTTRRAFFHRSFPTTLTSKPFSSARPIVTKEERNRLRSARKAKAATFLQEQGGTSASAGNGSTKASGSGPTTRSLVGISRYIWYLGLGIPAASLVWGLNDLESPPATLARAVGLTSAVSKYADVFARPSHEKLLPDWNDIPNVPHDIPIPHTLVLDLEKTLVSSTWDRKHGWRHAKRPGVDRFLNEMAQYYEIVLYSPSMDAVAEPVVNSLDKTGCIMHRLYRDATYYMDGVHVKDLMKLNRNVNRMIVLDDDPLEVQLNPGNLLRVKPYVDPTDRSDNTLERITPFLVEIARENYNDIPAVLAQFQGMDADEIADEQERRIEELKRDRYEQSQRALGRFGGSSPSLPTPELPPSSHHGAAVSGAPKQLTAKDLVGAPPTPTDQGGVMGWLNRRNEEKQEEQMRKMEKWNEIMLAKQKAKAEKAKAAAQHG